MADVIDRRTGERIQIPDDQLGELIASGAADDYDLQADQVIQVRDTETGEIKRTRAADLGTALKGGFEIATAAQIDEDRRQSLARA